MNKGGSKLNKGKCKEINTGRKINKSIDKEKVMIYNCGIGGVVMLRKYDIVVHEGYEFVYGGRLIIREEKLKLVRRFSDKTVEMLERFEFDLHYTDNLIVLRNDEIKVVLHRDDKEIKTAGYIKFDDLVGILEMLKEIDDV